MKIPLVAALIIAAAIVVWQYQRPPEIDSITTTAFTPVIKQNLAGDLSNAQVAQVDEPQSAAVAFPGEAQEIPYEIVHGIKVRKDRDCSVEVEHRFDPQTGDTRKIYSCIPNSPPDTDPYETYDTDVLAAMAYGDSHAAEVLGVRLLTSPDPEIESMGLQYLLRSVALSNDTRGIALAVNGRYSSLQSNNSFDLENIKRLVTLSHISNTVSPGTMSGAAYQKLLRDMGVNKDEITALIENGTLILEDMANVQSQITGNNHIREALDDA